tara:strand:+ start:798 stop:950 length:153 start_codon:yes stop_codon:yes gene_type:complete
MGLVISSIIPSSSNLAASTSSTGFILASISSNLPSLVCLIDPPFAGAIIS